MLFVLWMHTKFSAEHQAYICEKIERVVQILKDESKEPEERIRNAYISLADKNKNGIEGIGESFFTKILYFAGVGIESLTLKPLILNIFHNCHAKLPEINYQKPVKLQIRCKGTTFFSHMQIFLHFFGHLAQNR